MGLQPAPAGRTTGPVTMHPGQLTVTSGTVAALVAEQFPTWAELPVREVASHSTVNALFRIGDRLTARLPIQPDDPAETLRCLSQRRRLSLGAGPRGILRNDLGCDDQEWDRGKAWAFAQAIGLPWYYRTSNPIMSFIGRRTLDRLVRTEEPAATAVPGERTEP